MTDHADLTARLRRPRKVWVNGSAMTIMQPDDVYRDMLEAADALDAADAENARLTAERDEALARLLRLADWVQQYEMERDAARLSSASADLSLLASIRQSMFDEAEDVLAVSEEAAPDRRPLPSDGPDYHADPAAWQTRNEEATDAG